MDFVNEKKKFTALGKLLIFITLVILTGAPWWLTNYEAYTHNLIYTIISIAILASSVFMIKYFSNHKKRELILVGLASHQVAFIIKIFIDGLEDRTNHNLAPFEMLIFLMMDTLVCVISTFIGDIM